MIDVIAKKQCPGWSEAETHLTRCDPVMAEVIRRTGACTLSPRRDHFSALCNSIISQQISTAVAVVIYARFRGAFPRSRPTPAGLLALSDDALRGVGLSRQKVGYLRNIAEYFAAGHFPTRKLAKMDDEAVIQSLIPIKGVGRWTAEMFLIFVLNRTDVLPVDDLGLCKSAQLAYGLREYPTPETMRKLAEPWRPYRSVATWYLWRAVWKT